MVQRDRWKPHCSQNLDECRLQTEPAGCKQPAGSFVGHWNHRTAGCCRFLWETVEALVAQLVALLQVNRRLDAICQRLLNKGFSVVEKFHGEIYKEVSRLHVRGRVGCARGPEVGLGRMSEAGARLGRWREGG